MQRFFLVNLMTDNNIVQDDVVFFNRLKKGDEEAFKQLFDIYYRQLVAYANKFLADLDLARSVVQDLFVMLYEKRDEINIHTSFKSHLYQSVRNRCLNIIKRDKMKQEHHQHIFETNTDYSEQFDNLEYTELENCISNAVENLPAQCKKIFKMNRYEGIGNQKIADELNLSKRTVETQISKALKIIKNDLIKAGLFMGAFQIVIFLLI